MNIPRLTDTLKVSFEIAFRNISNAVELISLTEKKTFVAKSAVEMII